MKKKKDFPQNPTKIIFSSDMGYNANTLLSQKNVIDPVYLYFRDMMTNISWMFLKDFYTSIAKETCFDFINYKTKRDKYQFREYNANELKSIKYSKKYSILFEPVSTLNGIPTLAAIVNNISEFLKLFKADEEYRYVQKEEITKLFINVSQEDIKKIKTKVDKAFNNFLKYYSIQSNYCMADISGGTGKVSPNAFILNNFLEYYMAIEDTDKIFKIFETIHTIGNTKAINFSKQSNKRKSKVRSMKYPITIYTYQYHYYCSPLWPEIFEYYLLLFYSQYENGKYLNYCITKNKMLTEFIFILYRNFNNCMQYREKYIPKYCALFNKIKPKDVLTLEKYIFIQKAIMYKNNSPYEELNYLYNMLKQNMDITKVCFTDMSFFDHMEFIRSELRHFGFNQRNIILHILWDILSITNYNKMLTGVDKLCDILVNYFMYSDAKYDDKYTILEKIFLSLSPDINKNSIILNFTKCIPNIENEKTNELNTLITQFSIS